MMKCLTKHQELTEFNILHVIGKAKADPDFMEVINKLQICKDDTFLPFGNNCILTLYYMYNELKSHMSVNQQSNEPAVLAAMEQPSTSTVNGLTTNDSFKNNGEQSTWEIERESNPSTPPAPRPFESCIVCLENFSGMNVDEISVHMNTHLDQGAQEQSSSSVDGQQLVVNDKITNILGDRSRSPSLNNSLVDNQKYICENCDDGFSSKKEMMVHMKLAHIPKNVKVDKAAKVHKPKKLLLTCSLCPKKFSKMSSYKRHLLIHSGTKFKCSLCSKSLSTKDNLNRHMKNH